MHCVNKACWMRSPQVSSHLKHWLEGQGMELDSSIGAVRGFRFLGMSIYKLRKPHWQEKNLKHLDYDQLVMEHYSCFVYVLYLYIFWITTLCVKVVVK